MTGLIILAAGESLRLGKPKQKMIFRGKTLLQSAVSTGIHSCKPVIVILGAYAEEIQADIENEDVIVYYNLDWKEGMSSSIRASIEVLQKTPFPVTGAILMVSDQPFVDSKLVDSLIEKREITGKEIIACSYNDTLGVPALFGKRFFAELLSLKGQEGAKKIIMKHKESVATVPFPLGDFDIDTLADYEALMSQVEPQSHSGREEHGG
jgi:molybdenum cofactor cytidylyltransferase